MDTYYIKSTDNFTAKSLTEPLPTEPTPTLTKTEMRGTEATTAPLPAEPTSIPTTTEKRGYVLCACLDKCAMLGHRALSNHKFPYFQLNIHRICVVQNPKRDSSVIHSQICFSCCEKQNIAQTEANISNGLNTPATKINYTQRIV